MNSPKEITDKFAEPDCLTIEIANYGALAWQMTIEMLYRQHSSSLLLFAAAISGDRSRAQDAVHQVFAKLIEHGKVPDAIDVKAYLFASVRNAILNDVKARRRDVPIEPDALWFEPPRQDFAEELKLRRALQSIPHDQREVVILHVWGELTFSQLAEVLGIGSNTAASRYRYALARLREAMCTQEESCEEHR